MSLSKLLARVNAQSPLTGEIFIYDEISPWGVGANDFARLLGELRFQGVRSLNIHINSPGGDVFEGVAIYNLIRQFDGVRTVFIDGLAASIASVIALAGDRIVCAPNAMMMIHDPYCFTVGNAAEIRAQADMLDQVAAVMVGTYAERTKQAPDDLRRWMADETWMSATTAKERGFVHEITGEKAPEADPLLVPAASASFRLLEKFKKTPAALRAATTTPAMERPESLPAPTEVRPMKTVLAALALSLDATEADALAAVNARLAREKELLALTGRDTAGEALGVVQGWKQGAEQAQALADKLATIEASTRETEVVALVDGAEKAGKLVPAQRDWAIKLGRKDVGELKAFLETAPKIVTLNDEKKAPAPTGGNAAFPTKWEDMEPKQKAELHHSNPDLYKALKADYAARTKK